MRLQAWIEALRGSAELVEDFMAAAEAVLVSVIGRVACWLAPLPSAVLVSRAAGRVFGLTGAWSVIMAAVVELIGLVTSNLWLTAREWNENKRKSDPEANERLAVALLVSYFVTTIALLLAFEIPNILATGDLSGLTALLFPGLSAVGVIALNERVTHHGRVAEVDAAKRERKANRQTRRQTRRQGAGPGTSSEPSKTAKIGASLDAARQSRASRKQARMDALLDVFLDNPGAGPTEAGDVIGVSRQTVYNYLEELEAQGRVAQDNGRVKVL